MIRVLIVEDEPLIAEAHQAYLARVGGYEVVAVVSTAREKRKFPDDRCQSIPANHETRSEAAAAFATWLQDHS